VADAAQGRDPFRTGNMFFRLAVLFIVVPLVELALLVWLGGRIGFWPTIAIVVATGLAGAALARLAGLHVLLQIRREVMAGRMPVGHLLDGVLVLVGGVVLLTPGLLTDVLGFALLVPGTRRIARRVLERRLRGAVHSRRVQIFGPGGEDGEASQGRDVGPDG
jgi:UPF0716 protein FxsA